MGSLLTCAWCGDIISHRMWIENYGYCDYHKRTKMNFFEDNNRLKKNFGIRYGEIPRTKFIDNIEAIKVELINWPDEERLKNHLVAFATSSWFEDFQSVATQGDLDDAMRELMQGKILAQGLEGVNFSFRVSGLSLHGSHAIVRTRIGAAYLQQSQAVQDFRHTDILIPRSFNKLPESVEDYIRWVIEGKTVYSRLLDTTAIAITDARFALPKTIPVWININMSLPTILSTYSKRTDFTEEHPEMNQYAELLRIEIVKKFPWMDGYFKRDANCIHRFPGFRSNCVFKRDGPDVLKSQEPENWTFHDKTKKELMLLDADKIPLPRIKTRYFIGYEEVEQDKFETYRPFATFE
jgi:thymidylate synthase ThyX